MIILVRSPNWIGDCVMALPALNTLKKCLPEATIYVAAREYLCDLYRNIPEVEGVIPLPNKRDLKSTLAAANELKKFRFQYGILLTNSFRSAALLRLAGVKRLTGYNKDGRRFMLDNCLPFPKDNRHHIYFYFELIKAFVAKYIGTEAAEALVPARDYSGRLVVAPDLKHSVGEKLSALGMKPNEPMLGIAPSAAYGSAKQWLPERFGELLEKLHLQRPELQVLLFGADAERKKIQAITASLMEPSIKVFNLAGSLSLMESITAMSMCSGFISNDSGLMHIASSLDLPLTALFGPTRPEKTAPLNKDASVLHYPPRCAPCLHRDCPVADHPCMSAVTVDEVVATVMSKLPQPVTEKKNKAIFIDRDGTLVRLVDHCCRLEQTEIFDFSAEAVRRFKKMGFKVIVVTNQSAVARGICSVAEVEQFHRDVSEILKKEGAVLDGFYYSPYHPQGEIEEFKRSHPWRKPNPGMLLQAAEDFELDLSQSFMIGDNSGDIEAGINAGCKTVLVLTGWGERYREKLKQKGITPDIISENLLTAVADIDSYPEPG